MSNNLIIYSYLGLFFFFLINPYKLCLVYLKEIGGGGEEGKVEGKKFSILFIIIHLMIFFIKIYEKIFDNHK